MYTKPTISNRGTNVHEIFFVIQTSNADESRPSDHRARNYQCHLTEDAEHGTPSRQKHPWRCAVGRPVIDRVRRSSLTPSERNFCRPSVRRPHVPRYQKVTRSGPVVLKAGRTAPRRFERSSRLGSIRSGAAAYTIYSRRLANAPSIEWRSASDGLAVDLLISLERAVSYHGGPRIPVSAISLSATVDGARWVSVCRSHDSHGHMPSISPLCGCSTILLGSWSPPPRSIYEYK